MDTNLLLQIIKRGYYQPLNEEERHVLRQAFHEYHPVGYIGAFPAYVTRIETSFADDGEPDEEFVIEVRFPTPPINLG